MMTILKLDKFIFINLLMSDLALKLKIIN
jgi:hypothetical protein